MKKRRSSYALRTRLPGALERGAYSAEDVAAEGGALLEPYLDGAEARVVTDVLSRLTISYFLAPSDVVDLGDPASADAFLAPFIELLAPSAPATSAPA